MSIYQEIQFAAGSYSRLMSFKLTLWNRLPCADDEVKGQVGNSWIVLWCQSWGEEQDRTACVQCWALRTSWDYHVAALIRTDVLTFERSHAAHTVHVSTCGCCCCCWQLHSHCSSRVTLLYTCPTANEQSQKLNIAFKDIYRWDARLVCSHAGSSRLYSAHGSAQR